MKITALWLLHVALAIYDESILLDRLLNAYRLDFVGGDNCDLDQEKGELLWSVSPDDVPTKCLGYVEDSRAQYNSMVRPVKNCSQVVDVNFSMTLMQIVELNEREQYMTTSMMMTYGWKDEYLMWRPEMNGGVTEVVLPASKIWTPDVLLYNSLQDGFDTKYMSQVTIYYTGDVSWMPPALLQSSCEVDMLYFPFDTQTCNLKFGSWSYSKSTLNLQHTSPNNDLKGNGQTGEINIDDSAYIKSTEWQIASKTGTVHEVSYDCCPQVYQDITFSIKVKRYQYYPVFTLVVPCVMTAMLITLTFILPPDAGEKVGLNITILLAMVVFMDQLAQQTPPMPYQMPVIGQFFVSSMIIIALSLFSTIFCLKLHHTVGREAKAMPQWVRYVLLDLLPIVLFLHPPPDPPCEDEENLIKEEEPSFAPGSELEHVYKELKFISNRMRDEDFDGSYEDEWKYAALVLDRACAWLFFGGLTISFFATVCSAPGIFYDTTE